MLEILPSLMILMTGILNGSNIEIAVVAMLVCGCGNDTRGCRGLSSKARKISGYMPCRAKPFISVVAALFGYCRILKITNGQSRNHC